MSTPRPERPSSALSESWATLSASDIYSDDDSHSIQTDNVSLVGTSLPDDVASLDDHEEEQSDEAESTDTGGHCSEPRDYIPSHYHQEEEVGDNSFTPTAGFFASPHPIVFAEPDHWHATGIAQLKHTLGPVDDTDKILDNEGQLIATVYQTVSQEGLSLDRPFRVLYIGNSDFKGAVLDKLGDVLVANSKTVTHSSSVESSRFHVVPTAFGPDSAPNYAELLPLHVQLTVDECSAAYEDVNQPDRITLILKNGDRYSSYRSGSDYKISTISEWAPPDLAIFFISESEGADQLTSRYIAYYFMRRHRIACMFLSEKPLWGRERPSYPVDAQIVHIGLEKIDPVTRQVTIIGRCPIDLNTFESISPEQLNRNLSAVLNPPKSAPVPSQSRAIEVHESYDIEKYPQNSTFHNLVHSVSEPNPLLKNVTMALVGLITLFLGYAGIKFLTILFLQHLGFSDTSPALQASTPPGIEKSTNEPTALSPLPMTSDIAVAACGTEISLTMSEYIAHITRPITENSNELDRFQVHVLGDCHVIVKAPSMLKWKKGPRFDVKMTRTEKELPFELFRLFNGIYAIRLAREDAHGIINVTITTRTNAAIEQVTEIDFGTPWRRIAEWKRAAQALSSHLFNELNSAQLGLSEVYNHVSLDLQTMRNVIPGSFSSACFGPLERAVNCASDLVARSKKWYEGVHNDILASFAASSALLRDRAEIVQADLSAYARNVLTTVYQQARDVHGTAQKLRISHIGQQARRLGKSRALAVAQQHARCITRWYRQRDIPSCEGVRVGRTTFR
ncbi:hypothetical protein VTO42DRAFT_1861 [Malbranchea cinnamomea]